MTWPIQAGINDRPLRSASGSVSVRGLYADERFDFSDNISTCIQACRDPTANSLRALNVRDNPGWQVALISRLKIGVEAVTSGYDSPAVCRSALTLPLWPPPIVDICRRIVERHFLPDGNLTRCDQGLIIGPPCIWITAVIHEL